jgi:phosphoglucomutase
VVDKMKTINISDIGGLKVIATRDYSIGKRTDAMGNVSDIDCAKCNAVYYELDGGSFICIRPSGTEPKLKVYYSVKGADKENAKIAFETLKAEFEKIMQ